jgi:steroid 5-alpha reductase family enzyme
MSTLLIRTACLLFGYATLLYLIALRLKRNDVADAGWGIGFLVVIASAVVQYGVSLVPLIVYLMIALWALRLSVHMIRRIRSGPEDFRYLNWRKEWGSTFYWRSWLQVFLLQAFFLLIIAAPIFIAAPFEAVSLQKIQLPGLILWVAGWIIQLTADEQLHRFRKQKNKASRFLQSGLWKYSRHPNYLGEILMWWGIFLFVAPLPNGAWAIISPVTITLLLRYVSGVPLLEKKYEGDAAFEAYKGKTPVIFPWFPKK